MKKVSFLTLFAVTPVFVCTALGEDASNFETKFQLTTETFSSKQKTFFYLNALGTFYIDWGDGSNVQTISNTTAPSSAFDHTFPSGGPYTVRIGGLATGYPTATSSLITSAISFYAGRGNSKQELGNHITSISGSLGALFPTINGVQPSFNRTFYAASKLNCEIPPELFNGISGQMGAYMFNSMFMNASRLHGTIPYNIFANMTPATNMSNVMQYMFSGTGLSTTCPQNTEAYCTIYSDSGNNTNFCTTYWNSKVMCKPVQQCVAYYNGQCAQECTISRTLNTSTGLSIPLFGNKLTTPSLNIRRNNVTCYIPLESGNGGTNSLNVSWANTTYHAVSVTLE